MSSARFGGGAIPAQLVFLQRLRHDGGDVGRQRASWMRAQASGFVIADDAHCFGQRLATEVERQPSREQLVEDDAERVDVGSRVELRHVPDDLLGTHVAHRPDHLARHRLYRRLQFGLRGAREAEVEHLGPARFGDEDVGRLQVAVNDAAVMRVLHGVRDIGDEA